MQELAVLLRKLKSGGHKALIFTQMARMLDVLEVRCPNQFFDLSKGLPLSCTLTMLILRL